ncbi:MAG TPA: nuclear transport factor 2 family protein [Gemmatimonadaceae bacterium]|nr:nuclear transport factor 2 family protein [Gemmatimonadaceae bacterium]
MRTLKLFLAVLAAGLMLTPAAQAQPSNAEREAVRRAVLDYVDGFYTGDSTLHIRSIRPEVYKYGFSRRPDSTYAGMQMTWQGFHNFTNRVRSNNTPAPANAPKIIEIFDVADQTASAKLTAWWGIDYLLLAKYDGKWMISHVLWQSPPLKPASR